MGREEARTIGPTDHKRRNHARNTPVQARTTSNDAEALRLACMHLSDMVERTIESIGLHREEFT